MEGVGVEGAGGRGRFVGVEGEVGVATSSGREERLLGTNQEGYSGAFSEYTISLTCEWWKEVTHLAVQPTALIYSLQQATRRDVCLSARWLASSKLVLTHTMAMDSVPMYESVSISRWQGKCRVSQIRRQLSSVVDSCYKLHTSSVRLTATRAKCPTSGKHIRGLTVTLQRVVDSHLIN